jgi:hypothetical protein
LIEESIIEESESGGMHKLLKSPVYDNNTETKNENLKNISMPATYL